MVTYREYTLRMLDTSYCEKSVCYRWHTDDSIIVREKSGR